MKYRLTKIGRSLQCCSHCTQHWPARQSSPQLRVSIFSSPLYSQTDMYFCAHRFSNPCIFTIHNTQYICMSLHSKNSAIYKKNVPYFHASPQFNLKIPRIYIFFLLLFISLSALYVSKYFYATVSCRISISYVVIQKWIIRETQLNIVMKFRYKERKEVSSTAL